MTSSSSSAQRSWTLGLDLGTNSVGYAAIAYDSNGIPEEILYAGSVIHDGGQRGKSSHKADAGSARRTRNRYKQLRANRRKMDSTLRVHGYPYGENVIEQAVAAIGGGDIFDIRARLASTVIADAHLLSLCVAAAVRHMQSRRGYRNSWLSTEFVLGEAAQGYSEQYRQLHERCTDVCGKPLGDLTPAQLFVAAREMSPKYSTKVLPTGAIDALKKSATSHENARKDPAVVARTPEDVLLAATKTKVAMVKEEDVPLLLKRIEHDLLHQSLRRADIIRELHTIARVQGLDDAFVDEVARLIIFNEHPSKGVEERVKLDDLPTTGERHPRALKASLAFQSFRITAQVATLRHVGGERLTSEEQSSAREFLQGWSDTDTRPTWSDVAEAVGVKRFAKADNLSRPEINTTALRILTKGGALKEFWTDTSTTDAHRAVLVGILTSDTGALNRASSTAQQVQAWVDTLDEKTIASFDTLKFEPGRAAHSEQTMLQLTAYMQDPRNTTNDLHTARKEVFGVDDTWRPHPSPLGTPVGNPTVDANIKLTKRVFDMIVSRVGCPPERVVVESARDIVNSAATRGKITSANNQRRKDKNTALEEALSKYAENAEGEATKAVLRKSDTMRLVLLHEQNGTCLYCGSGTPLSLTTMEVDHIVPVSRGGSNSRINLAAVCRSCNSSKLDTPFAQWASTEVYASTVKRIKAMVPASASKGLARTKWINTYVAQLKATECERPLESLSWAALEVRDQLEGALPPVDKGSRVLVVPGRITSDVRYMAGIDTEKHPILLRYPDHTVKGKSRLDRRHHAIDAAVLTTIRQSTVTVMSERNLLREEARLAAGGGEIPDVTWEEDGIKVNGRWDSYSGGARDRFAFAQTRNALDALRALLIDAVEEDRIPVTRVVRWTPSTAGIHDDTIAKFEVRHLGDAIPSNVIDRAATPALWTALTRLMDYSEKDGVPEDPTREVTVKGKRLTATDRVNFFPGSGGMLEVRRGYAVASGIHHLRLLRVESSPDKKGNTKVETHVVRVYTFDAARLHHSGKDVFSTQLADSTLTMRDAGLKARNAFRRASEWKVITKGDEIVLSPEQCASSKAGVAQKFYETFPHLHEYRFLVRGYSNSNVKVSASVVSPEGAPEKLLKTLFSGDACMGSGTLIGKHISRRNLLGEERLNGTYALRTGVL